MIDICSVCLCTGIELQTLEEALNKFYNDLCNIKTNEYGLYCPKCSYLLKHFYNFKNECQKANYLLNEWRKQSKITRIPLHKLNTQLSHSTPSLNNDSDYQASYCYNDAEEHTDSKSEMGNLDYCQDKDVDIKPTSIISERNKTEKTTIKVKLDDNYILVDVPILSEVKTERQINDDCDPGKYVDVIISEDIKDNVRTLHNNNTHQTTTNTTRKQVSNKRKTSSKPTIGEPKQKKLKSLLKHDLEEIKRNVKRRLGNGEVTDNDGNVIDADVILNNLDKMHNNTWAAIQKYCAGNNPLTPEAINFLNQMHQRYGNQYSRVFITKHLTTDQDIMEDMRKRETNQNYVQAEHKCARCFKYFKSPKMLDYHVAHFHDPSKPLKCQYCEVTFSGRKLLNRHIQTHKVVYQCKLCPLVTHHTTVMDVHFNIHNGVKYPCTKCGSVFKSPPTLAAHMNSKHGESFTCSCCARLFHNMKGLKLHKLLKHRDDIDTVGPPSAKCEQCDIQFISDVVYLEHQRKRHGAPGLTPGGRARAPRKKRTPCPNPKTPKYTCRTCAHVESSIGALIWHFKIEHPTEEFDRKLVARRDPYQFLCHECGEGFRDITKLTDHKNVHAGVCPYTCTECPKAFHSRQHLRHHMKFHAPPTYQCDQCDKKFHSGANLCNHKRVHIGDRRYACKLCGKTFLHQGSVNEHIRGVHQHIRRKRKHTKQN